MLRKRTLVPRTCEYCGTVFEITTDRLKYGRGRHCSAVCARRNQPVTIRVDPVERFWSKVDKSAGPDGCWLWTAGLGGGYGSFWVDGHNVRANRFAYEVTNGPIPDGLHVCHDCPDGDNPRCVNPKHLWLGTSEENSRDRHEKGRDASGDRSGAVTKPERVPRGSRNGCAKLTETQVVGIRRRFAGGETQTELARAFGVSQSAIWLIVREKKWTHI